MTFRSAPVGAAYGQMGRHADAVRVVMQGVTAQPSNAAARYGLAVAYANAEHRDYALTAAQQALQLQPDYPQAQALIARLSGTSSAPPATVMGAMPTTYPTTAPASYGEPTQALSGPSAAPTAYGQPASPAPYEQTQRLPVQSRPPVGQPTTPYGHQPQASYGKPQPPYQQQGAAAYGSSPPSTYYVPPTRPSIMQPPDKFDMKQAMRDWVRVIREPNTFFREQAERTGYNAPLSFLLTFGLVIGVFAIISGLIRLALSPSSAAIILFQMVVGATSGITGALMGAFLWGGVLHLVGRMFGNRQPYHNTFRVATYSRAPMLIFTALILLITPFVMPTSTFLSPFTPRSTNTPSPFGQMVPVQYTESSGPFSAPRGKTYGSPGGTTSSRYGWLKVDQSLGRS